MNRSTRQEQPQPPDAYLVWAICGLILVSVAIVFGQTLWYGLLDYDDTTFVTNNPHVRTGLRFDNIRWAITNGPGGEWYPLAMWSHMLDCQLFGLKGWGHHLTNVLLHAATSIALFLVLLRMTGQRAVPGTDRRLVAAQASGGRVAPAGPSATTPQRAVPEAAQASGGRVAAAGPSATTLWPSAIVALLFAIHPQHVESVAWIAERRDVLSGLFFVLTLGAYWGYVQNGRSRAWYFATAAMLALSLAAKSTAVTVPPLLLLLDFWPLGRWGNAIDLPDRPGSADRPGLTWLVVEKLPLLALSVGACVLTLSTHVKAPSSVPLVLRLQGAPIACVRYVLQFFFPADLAVFYPYPLGGWPLWQVAGATAIVLAISAAVVIGRRRYPYCLVGWFWFLGMLVPVLGLVQVSRHAMADRYTYLSSIGLSIAVVWRLARWGAVSLDRCWALRWGAAAALAALGACAVRQTSFWSNEETLWRHTLAVTDDNSEAEVGLADALRQQQRLDEAIAHYQAAVKLPCESAAYNNFGAALIRQGKLDEAIAKFQRALEIEPSNAEAHANLGAVLGVLKRWADAEKHLRRAIELNPDKATTHFDLAHVLRAMGDSAGSLQQFEQAIEIEPANPAFHNDLAMALQSQGQSQRAIDEFAAAARLAPGFLPARLNLATALAAAGRSKEALEECRQVLQIDFRNEAARRLLQKILSEQARPASP